MVWNHPKETTICMLRMFQLCTSWYQPGAVGVRKLGEEQQSEDGRQPQFGKQAGAWNRLDFFYPLTFFDHIRQPLLFRFFRGEIQMERGNPPGISTNMLLYCLCAHFYMVDFHCYSCLTSTISHSAKRCNIESQRSKVMTWHSPQIERKEHKRNKKTHQMGTGEWSVAGGSQGWARSRSPEECGIQRQNETKGLWLTPMKNT